jgi:uncharacterized protein DUF6064
MTLPFTGDEFFDVLAAYNERLWPFVLMLWLVTAYAVVMLARARPVRPWFIAGLLAFQWAWSGLAYHAAFFSRINPAAWVFAGLFLLEAVLLVWYGVVHHRFQLSRGPIFQQVLSCGLIAYALLYPAIARAEGHAFPRLPIFAVPCPTTILTIGLLLAADRSLPRLVAVVPLIWAFIGGSAAFLFGVRADLMLLAAGVALAVDLIRPRRPRTTSQIAVSNLHSLSPDPKISSARQRRAVT